MSSPFAIDTNIAIYAFTKDERRLAAISLIEAGPKISIQLLNEFVSVSLRKRKTDWVEIEESLDILSGLATSVRALDFDVHDLGRILSRRHQLGFYDALIVAAAMLDGCKTLYSEDMQHGQVFDNTLTIINPFLPKEPA